MPLCQRQTTGQKLTRLSVDGRRKFTVSVCVCVCVCACVRVCVRVCEQVMLELRVTSGFPELC